MKIDAATQRQITAADPEVSTWLTANAGSGKTRVLTDRVARLLLSGVMPQHILCLTYTKAAASEMQIRLFKRLGEWAMTADAPLSKALEKLGEPSGAKPDRLDYARTLFARAIDTPGGLRIQTIHSFCASLLRRFPLEAGVSPLFREIDERTASILRNDTVETMTAGEHGSIIREVAALYSGEDFNRLAAQAIRHRATAGEPKTDLQVWEQFGLPDGFDDASLLSSVFLGSEAKLITGLIDALRASEKSSDHKAAKKLAAVDLGQPNMAGLAALMNVFLFGPTAKAPYGAKIGAFPTKDVRDNHADLIAELNQLMARVENAHEQRARLAGAQATRAFYRFSAAFLPLYEMAKSARGWMDFDDLITRARNLLSDPAVAQWVLFRLDGGLDHILVDEAQDTSPEQWNVIELLAQEFSAGIGARSDIQRTIFVVGDLKQSIFSFQGADPQAFNQMRQHFSKNLVAAQQQLFDRSLEHSFRSSPAILNVVDAVVGQAGIGIESAVSHLAFHENMPGRVDLWEVVEQSQDTPEKEWFDPTDKVAANDHRVQLAEAIAGQIEDIVGSERIYDEDGNLRPVRYGDVLILVRSRAELFHQLIRACKSRDLPIAGADRLKIGAEIAVKDLQAVLDFLALPEDNLSLATTLRSPLFGLSEDQLYSLAQGRGDMLLWQALVNRKSEFADAFEVLSDLRNQADFLRPHDLLSRILARHGGRTRLLARLGPEAEDGIDALLSQALVYEATQTPSLTGFLIWLGTDGLEIKRQSDSSDNRIRVMTIHGAKGLEAPIVILPDSGDKRRHGGDDILPTPDDGLMWRTPAELQPQAMRQILANAHTARDQENGRLLYVALTRAEKWLIVCAAGEAKPDKNSWYQTVKTGMVAAGAETWISPTGPGMRLEYGHWPERQAKTASSEDDGAGLLPDWVGKQITTKRAPVVISPSKMGGEKALRGADGDIQDASRDALAHGTQVHALLENLPRHPQPDWAKVSQHLLRTMGFDLNDQTIDELVHEATAVILGPDTAHLFGPECLAEVDVTATLPDLDNNRIRGSIDRLLVSNKRIVIADFKSNRVIPPNPADTPHGILRQMAAYLHAVELIYPGREIELAIVWTHNASYMVLPHDIVRPALV